MLSKDHPTLGDMASDTGFVLGPRVPFRHLGRTDHCFSGFGVLHRDRRRSAASEENERQENGEISHRHPGAYRCPMAAPLMLGAYLAASGVGPPSVADRVAGPPSIQPGRGAMACAAAG